uniref:Glutathione S-transferase n=1 Tax=Rheum australe TaxID=284363 RepID=B5M1Y9_RHEAU|nr:glutathione-S-transferase 2 [Rheum australe]
MGKEVVLLDFWPSMFGIRARIALAEKGVDYDYQEEDLLHGQKSELLLEMNPVHKKIPVLIHNGRPVCESLVILEYIDEVWADRAQLMPSDPYRRAQARFWADYIDNKVINGGVMIGKTKGEEKEKAKAEFIGALKVLEEQALGDAPFFGGDEFGFLDVVLVAYYCWFHAIEVEGNFKVEESCPKICAWGRPCMQRDNVAKSLPDPQRIHGYVLELKNKYGF